jgi:hypothetical protein
LVATHRWGVLYAWVGGVYHTVTRVTLSPNVERGAGPPRSLRDQPDDEGSAGPLEFNCSGHGLHRWSGLHDLGGEPRVGEELVGGEEACEMRCAGAGAAFDRGDRGR